LLIFARERKTKLNFIAIVIKFLMGSSQRHIKSARQKQQLYTGFN